MNDEKVPWLNIWMALAACLVIRATVFAEDTSGWVRWSIALVLPALTLVVAILRAPSLRLPCGRSGLTLNDLGDVYLGAWRRLRRQKWILVVFGVFAAVSLAGSMVDEGLYALVRNAQAQRSAGSGGG